MSTRWSLLPVEQLEAILDDIRKYKISEGYPMDEENYLACPYERLKNAKCMKISMKEWGGHGRLNTLM
jgi:hypothetical protein